MGKVISAGHICLDITPVFPAEKNYTQVGDLLTPGKLIQMDAASVHTGGSVANTGLALKLLGNDVTLLGKVGKDAFGGMVQYILSGYGASGLIVDETAPRPILWYWLFRGSTGSSCIILEQTTLSPQTIFRRKPCGMRRFSTLAIPR